VTQVLALSRMRFAGYARSQRVLAPVLASLALVAMLQAGGDASAVDAYGVSAVGLFGIFAWQAKLALDTEPDAQRQLSYLAVGSARREVAAGLVAAGLTAAPTLVVGMVAPWLSGTVQSPPTTVALVGALGFGLWVHLLSALPAVAVGAFASRAVTRTRGWGVAMLVGASVMVLVLGLNGAGPLRWLVPQIIGAIKAGEDGDLGSGVVITLHAIAWSALFFAGYLVLRARRR
jgi:hypothetical protein